MQCSICFEPYNIRERRPKIVPCGHTFCLQCLKRFRAKECPSCRTMFPCTPEDLIDNFLALEENADMKFVQRALWCDTCNDAPKPECVQCHDVLSSRMAQARLESSLTEALREQELILLAERKAHERIRFGFEDAIEALNADTTRAEASVKSHRGSTGSLQRRYSAGGVLGGGSSGVKATKINIKDAEAQTAAALDKLAIMDATEAEIKIKVGGLWRSFSLDLTQEAQEMHKLVLFGAYLLARLMPPCVRSSQSYEVTASVVTSQGAALPDVTIEFLDTPQRDQLQEHWAKGWRIYSICKWCLESSHSVHFSPQPPSTSEWRVEKGALCMGRTNGRYYFILCDNMAAKFLLPLTASFKVVGRVTRNLSSLEEAARAIHGGDAKEMVHIKPKPAVV